MRITGLLLAAVSSLLLSGCKDAALAPTGTAKQLVSEGEDFSEALTMGGIVKFPRDRSRILVRADREVSSLVRRALAASGIHVLSEGVSHERTLEFRVERGELQRDSAALARSSVIPGVTFAGHGPFSPGQSSEITPLGRVAVAFKRGSGNSTAEGLALRYGVALLSVANPDSGRYWWTLAIPPSRWMDPLAFARELGQQDGVLWTEAILAGGITKASPNDPFYYLQYQLKNADMLYGITVDINIEPAWPYATGQGIRVAVLDNGVDAGNPDLAGRVTAGRDFFTNNLCSAPVDCASHPLAVDSHGTSVAGLVGAAKDNAFGPAGVAPGVTIIPVRIFRDQQFLAADSLAIAFHWAWSTAGADIISNSWTFASAGYYSNVPKLAIDTARTYGRSGKGAVAVFSVGNGAQRSIGNADVVHFPATVGGVVAVTAMTKGGLAADHAPDGSQIAVAAPSASSVGYCGMLNGIVSTEPTYSGCASGGVAGVTDGFGGTSAAAPLASGIAALLLERWPQLHDTDVRGRLMTSADPWGATQTFGFGKLNAGRALSATWAPPTVQISGPTSVKPRALCEWTAIVSAGVSPYTYLWKLNGNQVSTDDWFQFSNLGSGSFILSLTVTDAIGTVKTVSKTVTVSSSAAVCQ